MRYAAAILLLVVLALSGGCGSVISEGLIKEVDRGATVDIVQARPEAFEGRTVLWGGVIVTTDHLEDATEIEVLETPLSWTDRPKEPSDAGSRGRFIIRSERFLDKAIYAEGKRVTVAGAIRGIKTKKIGKMEYPFPVVSPLELKIFEPIPDVKDYPPMPPWYWYEPYDPFWPYPPGYPRYPYYPYYPWRHHPGW